MSNIFSYEAVVLSKNPGLGPSHRMNQRVERLLGRAATNVEVGTEGLAQLRMEAASAHRAKLLKTELESSI